jgi:hypothetical protein
MVLTMKKRQTGYIGTLLLCLLLATSAWAKLPEPDNIVYGLLPDTATTISMQVNGTVISQYTRGDNPDAGDFFVLRVPIDSMDPQTAGTARPGDNGAIYLDAATDPVTTVTIGERGTVQRIYLPGTPPPDTDGDGVADADDNCPGIANADQEDTNGNGIGDACDDSDSDQDGYSDRLEYAYFNSGRLDLDGNPYDPAVANAPGDDGYVPVQKNQDNFWLLVLPAILHAAGQ